MALKEKKRILVADSELMDLATLVGTLKDDYRVVVAKSPKDITHQLTQNSIDMILLDTRFNQEDGFNLCQRLKADGPGKDIPLILISTESGVSAEARGFSVGAVDYISKPFNAPTALARIRNQIKLNEAIKELKRLNHLALDANPNTGLPGNNSIRKELQRVIDQNEDSCVVYADLDHFKIYNDTYGFAKGDDVIIFTANVIQVALQATGCEDAFVGHIGGDDFVFTLPSSHCQAATDEIIQRIEQGIPQFYTEEDVRNGQVSAINREGNEQNYPLISLSMGGIDLSKRKIETVFEIIDICTEMKKAAKKKAGSAFLLCQRQSA